MRIGHFSFKSGRLLLWNQALNNQFLGLMNGIGKQRMLSDVTWECGQEKVRGKEREQRKRKDREEEELERVRLKAQHKDVVTAYQALLKEKIKDPEVATFS